MTDRKKSGSGRRSRASAKSSSRSRGRAKTMAAGSGDKPQRVQQSLEEAEAEAVKAAMEKREENAQQAEAVDADHAKTVAKTRGAAEDAQVLSEEKPSAKPVDNTKEKPSDNSVNSAVDSSEGKPAGAPNAGQKAEQKEASAKAAPKPEPIFSTQSPRQSPPEAAPAKPAAYPILTVALAALIGGLVGAGAVWMRAPDTAALEERLSAMEARDAGASNQVPIEALETRLGKLEQQVDAVASAPAGADPAAAEERRVLQEAQNQLGEANRSLTERLGQIETALADRDAASAETLETLRAQIAASGGGKAGASSGGPAQDPRVDGLEQRLAAVEEQAKTLSGAAESGADQATIDAATDELSSRIQALDTELASLSEQIAGGAEDAREIMAYLNKIETRVAALETESKAFAQGEAAIGVAFGVLSQAVAGSAPYADALATVERIAETEAPAALKDHAATGLPSVGALAARFDEASRDALAALSQAEADEEGDMADALAKRLSSFVTIRRTEESEGDDAASVLSRAEARIDEGDVSAALKEIDALPQAARSGMGDWLRDAHIRADAEAALDDLRRKLLPAQ